MKLEEFDEVLNGGSSARRLIGCEGSRLRFQRKGHAIR